MREDDGGNSESELERVSTTYIDISFSNTY